MHFQIRIDLPSGKYRMQVERIHAGDALGKFRITGGARSLVLQSNRPTLLTTSVRKGVQWKVLEVPPAHGGTAESVTYALYKVMQEIELYLKKEEPTLQKYLANRAIEQNEGAEALKPPHT